VIRRPVHLPIRVWLSLALVVLLLVPTLTIWWLSTALAGWEQQAQQARLATAERLVSTNVARWDDDAWRRHAAAQLHALRVLVQLVDDTGQHVLDISQGTAPAKFATVAHTSLAALPNDPSAGPSPRQVALAALPKGAEQLTITSPARPGHPSVVRGTAYFIVLPSSPDDQTWVLPLGGPTPLALRLAGPRWLIPLSCTLAALLLTLAGLAWFVGRTILRPLAAMSRAARQIAAGDLEVQLRPSQAREVADVAAALQAMSTALSASLARQVELEDQRRLFIGALVHDLRTPLFTLRAHLRGLQDGLATTPVKAAHYVAVCCEKADALERLVADLFAYTRVELLEETLQSEPLELGALLVHAVAVFQPRAAAKGVNLAAACPADPLPLLGDSALLARVLENLLENALRHTPVGGEVAVRWRRETSHLVFSVEDTGPGFAPADLPHLFTPLYRGEASRNRATGGAGLGLAIARGILRAHGGDLTAANRVAGGALLTGTLPAMRQADELPA
jgi:signal transduction histidine kinase